eukprot:5222581-Prymnesium_polylepis.1
MRAEDPHAVAELEGEPLCVLTGYRNEAREHGTRAPGAAHGAPRRVCEGRLHPSLVVLNSWSA